MIAYAHNFKETIAKGSEEKAVYDIILLDLRLPDKNEEEVVTEMLVLAPAIPIIILTGFTDIDFSIKSIGKVIMNYILKDDLNAGILYKSIIYAIERKKLITKLKESEKRYSDPFHLSPQPMCLYDPV